MLHLLGPDVNSGLSSPPRAWVMCRLTVQKLCRRMVGTQRRGLAIQNPIVSNEDLDTIKCIKHQYFQAASVSVLYDVEKGHNGLQQAIENIISQVKEKVSKGAPPSPSLNYSQVKGMYVCMYNPRKLRGVDCYPAATGGPARAYSLNRF